MPITFDCASCDRDFNVPDAAAGKRATCKGCGATTHVPRPLTLEPGPFRPHHYEFAHRFLPGVSFGGAAGSGLLLVLASDHEGEVLRRYWSAAAEQLPAELHMPPHGLKGTFVEVDEQLSLAVLQLPPARRVPEALFLAGVYVTGQGGLPFRRLLTLELTLSQHARRPSTMLCEWAPGPDRLVHVNWGFEGPWADSRELFVRAVRDLLDDPDREPMAVT